MLKLYKCFSSLVVLVILNAPAIQTAQIQSGIDPEALIERILAVNEKQRSEIKDVVFDAEYIEGKKESDGSFKEEKRFVKKVYIKYLPDTTWLHEEYLEYYKDGKLQEPKKRDEEAANRLEKKKKRKTGDISYPILRPFYPEYRDKYDLSYEGVADEKVNGYVCHHFFVTPKEKKKGLINGHYYFEAESFHLVRVDFSPAKLTKKLMFRLNQLNMSILYAPTPDGFWLPKQFDIEGKGKAAFLFGVKFAGTEYYRNPRINSGIKAEIFEVNDD
ncbi:MAG: hypothetical protein ACE5K8_03010 [Candidatus Zixiibacteriota bacterium]